MENNDLKRRIMGSFVPMSEEEQKLLLFMCLDAYYELQDKYEKAKMKKDRLAIRVQMDTYDMIINLYISGNREYILNTYTKKKYEEFEKDDDC